MDAPTPLTLPDAVFFSVRAALAATAAYFLYERFLTIPGAVWAAVSALLVSQPSLHPSLRASLARCLANLIGAACGAVCVVLFQPGMAALAVGVVATGTACHLARLNDALRPAYVAVAIVVLTLSASASASIWTACLDRLVAVAIGCAVSIAVALAFDAASGGLRRHVVARQGETE